MKKTSEELSTLNAQRSTLNAGGYTIVGSEQIEIGRLVPHPAAAAFPNDPEDRRVLHANIAGGSLKNPLIVTMDGSGKPDAPVLVLDGLGRLEALRASGASSVWCTVVETDDPESVVYDCNNSGRKQTTGSRLVNHVWKNRQNVVLAATALKTLVSPEGHGDLQGKNKGRAVVEGRIAGVQPALYPYTAKGIAEALGVSEKDAQIAVTLVCCAVRNESPADGKALDDRSRAILDKTLASLRCGMTPIRRAMCAIGGATATVDQARGETDWSEMARLGISRLKKAIPHLNDMPVKKRAETITAWMELSEMMKSLMTGGE